MTSRRPSAARRTRLPAAADPAAAGGGDPAVAPQADHGGRADPAGAALDAGRRLRARRPAAAGQRRTRGSVDRATTGGLNFAAFSFFVSAGFLLVVAVALFCGDTVASEASWSSLRYLLAAPVPRARLLRQKLAVALGLLDGRP